MKTAIFILLSGMLLPPLLGACVLESFPQILILNTQQLSSGEIIANSNCSPEIKEEFASFVANYPGKILKTKFLASMLTAVFPTQEINLQPAVITILGLNDYLKEQKILDSSYLLQEVAAISGKKALVSTGQGNWQINHLRSGQLGRQYFSITSEQKKQYWISALLLINTKALVAKQNLGVGKLTAQDLGSLQINTSAPQDLFIDQDLLPFLRLNRPLNAGEWLTKQAVSPLTLVENGDSVIVHMRASNISLQTTAMALQAGKYDDNIKLKTIPDNKIISAKVINFNQVKVDL